jgi:hypothetical protein
MAFLHGEDRGWHFIGDVATKMADREKLKHRVASLLDRSWHMAAATGRKSKLFTSDFSLAQYAWALNTRAIMLPFLWGPLCS